MRKWLVAVDYRSNTGIRVYSYYSFENAVACFESNADPENNDIILSVALYDQSSDVGLPKLIKKKVWRDEK